MLDIATVINSFHTTYKFESAVICDDGFLTSFILLGAESGLDHVIVDGRSFCKSSPIFTACESPQGRHAVILVMMKHFPWAFKSYAA